MRDPYVVLELPKGEGGPAVAKAYRRLAFMYHPDRAPSGELERYQARFTEINDAYAVLADPERKRKFDAYGFESLEEDKSKVTVDGDHLARGGTHVLAAVLTKLGLKDIRTTVPGALLEAISGGGYAAPPKTLTFGDPVTSRCERNTVQLFELRVTDRQAQSGFAVSVAAPAADKFKLLLFEEPRRSNRGGAGGAGAGEEEASAPSGAPPEGGWILSEIIDSTLLTTRKNGSMAHAAATFLDFDVYELGPKPKDKEIKEKPENALFLRLESLQPRTKHFSRSGGGRYLFGVYGDNFLSKSTFTIEALSAAHNFSAVQGLREVEGLLLHKRQELMDFEREYERAKEAWNAISKRYESELLAVDDLIKERGDSYRSLMPTACAIGVLERPPPAAASSSSSTKELATGAGGSAALSLSSMLGSLRPAVGGGGGGGAKTPQEDGAAAEEGRRPFEVLGEKLTSGLQFAKQGVSSLVEKAQQSRAASGSVRMGAESPVAGSTVDAGGPEGAGSGPGFASLLPSFERGREHLSQGVAAVAEMGSKIKSSIQRRTAGAGSGPGGEVQETVIATEEGGVEGLPSDSDSPAAAESDGVGGSSSDVRHACAGDAGPLKDEQPA